MKYLDFLDITCGFGYDVLSRMSKKGKKTLLLMEKHKASGLSAFDFVDAIPKLTPFDYWTLLGSLYIHGGYSFMLVKTWRLLMNAGIPKRGAIMQPFEHKALKVLPKAVTCYRIHHPGEKDWISYTISSWLVPQFVEQYKEHDAFDRVEKFKVKKKDIDFFFGRNGEDEIVVLDKSKVHKYEKVK